MSTEVSHEQIRKQIEFYFCDANLSRDSFLKEKIAEDREGYVTIACLLTFKKLAGLTTDVQAVVAAIKDSEALEVHPDGLSLKRINPFDATIDHNLRTSVIYPIPGEATEEEIRQAIEKFCPESHIAAIWRKRKKHPVSKLTMHVAEIHWEKEADVQLLIEKSENGKQIAFPAAEDVAKAEEITTMAKDTFEAMFSKNAEKNQVVYKGSDYTAADLKNRVIDLSADCSLGPVRHIKRVLSETLRESIMYVHVLDGELNRMLVMFDTEESCTTALGEYDGAPKPQDGDAKEKDTPADEEKDQEAKLKAKVVEEEAMLNTVLVGFHEHMKTRVSGKKNYGGRKNYGGQKRNHFKGGMGKKKWQRR